MLLSLLLSSVLLTTVYAQQYAYGVDINQAASSSNFQCLRQNSYSTVFVRAYKPDGTGTVDYNAVPNINMAFQAGLGIEVFMTPNPTSSKTAYTQVDEVISALSNGGVSIRSLWIQVTSPVNWNKNQQTNVNFVNSAIQRIRITNQAKNLGNDVMLWYWSVFSSGVSGESAPNFQDFRPFGNWNSAAVKQFGQKESVCGFTANRDVYPLSSVVLNEKFMNTTQSDKEKTIVVGSIGLERREMRE